MTFVRICKGAPQPRYPMGKVFSQPVTSPQTLIVLSHTFRDEPFFFWFLKITIE